MKKLIIIINLLLSFMIYAELDDTKKISINLNTNLENSFNIISKISKVNIFLDEGVLIEKPVQLQIEGLTIKEVLDKFDPEVVRFFLLSTHYRSPVEFSDEQLREAESSIDRYYSTIVRINDFLEKEDSGKEEFSNAGEIFEGLLLSFQEKFKEAMDDDFNTALALGHIFELIREANRFLDNKPSGSKDRELLLKTKEVLLETGIILNIFGRTPYEWYLSLMKIRKIGLSEKDIPEKIRERQAARQRKDWHTADTIRKELEEKGIILEDKKDRTDWKIKIG
jgi:cysteinyl-tRNA synthetase